MSASLSVGIPLPPDMERAIELDALAQRYSITPAQALDLQLWEVQAAWAGVAFQNAQQRIALHR